MKFDYIIGNPPYGGVYIPIMERCADLFEKEMVFLQPSDWLKLNEFKEKTWNNVKDRLESVEFISNEDATKMFRGTTIRSNLGIFRFSKNGGYKLGFNDALLDIKEKIRSCVSLRSIHSKTVGEFYIPLQGDCGHAKGWHMTLAHMFSGNPQAKLRFATSLERDCFLESMKLNVYAFICKIDDGAIPAHLPWLGDYTKVWTNDNVYEYLRINENEKRIIEEMLA